MKPLLLVCTALTLFVVPRTLSALDVDILRSSGGLPPHIAGVFDEAVDFQQAADGTYYVFDRRGHAVHVVDAARTGARKLVDIGHETGRIIQPTGFDLAPDGSFVVADVPRAQQRLQTFSAAGLPVGTFLLPGQPAARIIVDNLMLNGAGSVQHTGRTLLLSHPESGALFTEYSLKGYPQRSIGSLRATGFEHDRQLHLAMNAGLPLADPNGGFYYIFITGTPLLRKYDEQGTLAYERFIQGRELDAFLAAQPNQWPRRQVQDRQVPFVTPVIRAAAVDRAGRVWISLGIPYTYVYDADGDKVRTVQFQAAGIVSPTSLFFTADGRLLVTPGLFEFGAR